MQHQHTFAKVYIYNIYIFKLFFIYSFIFYYYWWYSKPPLLITYMFSFSFHSFIFTLHTLFMVLWCNRLFSFFPYRITVRTTWTSQQYNTLFFQELIDGWEKSLLFTTKIPSQRGFLVVVRHVVTKHRSDLHISPNLQVLSNVILSRVGAILQVSCTLQTRTDGRTMPKRTYLVLKQRFCNILNRS